jgi:hypothetical protein
MTELLSQILTKLSNYFSGRKGLLPFLGIIFVLINFILRFFPPNWFNQTDFFLHLGLIITIFGFMLAWAL